MQVTHFPSVAPKTAQKTSFSALLRDRGRLAVLKQMMYTKVSLKSTRTKEIIDRKIQWTHFTDGECRGDHYMLLGGTV